jgi:hypothetical protein
MKSLDFMIVGAQKAGTTALAHFLDQHPAIAMSNRKEVHLFDAPTYSHTWSVEDINQRYQAHFTPAAEACQLGEATPVYLFFQEIAAELHRYKPDLKLIIMLRDPVERVLSHYSMELSRGNERLPLWLALLAEPWRLYRNPGRQVGAAHRLHSYLARGCYASQIANLRRYFPDQQLLIIDNSELKSNHAAVMRRVFEFLGVDSSITIPPADIFSGNYCPLPALLRGLLRIYFRGPNRRLRALLATMGHQPRCPWLK